MKLSNSSMTTFQSCPKSYEYKYKKKIYSKYKSSALYFGGALDNALNFILLNKDKDPLILLKESYEIFVHNWTTYKEKELEFDLSKNITINYSKYDFEYDLLNDADKNLLNDLFNNDFIEKRNKIIEKMNYIEFHNLSDLDKLLVNYSSWLCLKNKAYYLLEAYINDIVPTIKKVIDVQRTIQLIDEHDNELMGIVDLIIELDDGSIAVIDNKTASFKYDEKSVRVSNQLALYQTILNELNKNLSEEYPHKITKAGYFIVIKKLEKETRKTCKICNSVTTTTHKTCNNINSLTNIRCNGEFEKTIKFKALTQIIIDEIHPHIGEMVLENATNIKEAIEQEHFPRNFNSCINKYNQTCDYYDLCWYRKEDKLIKKE